MCGEGGGGAGDVGRRCDVGTMTRWAAGFICGGYIAFDFVHPPVSGSRTVNYANCAYRGVETMCGPRGIAGGADHLFHQNSDGTFTDVSEKLGVDNKAGYYGLGALFVDVNNDGKPGSDCGG